MQQDISLLCSQKKRKDVDLRQLLNAKKPPPVYSIADKVASLTKNKVDDESDQDEESELVIEMPTEDEDKEKGKLSNEQSKTNYLFFSLPVYKARFIIILSLRKD